MGFPGGAVIKNPPANARDSSYRFDPLLRKIPWGMKWQSTPLFLRGEFHRQRSLVGFTPWAYRELDTSSN